MCFLRQEKNRLCGRVKRRCPIFPWGYPQSIIRAEELNDRVRDGNGCTLFAIITGSPAHTGGSLDRTYVTTIATSCQYFLQPDSGSVNYCWADLLWRRAKASRG